MNELSKSEEMARRVAGVSSRLARTLSEHVVANEDEVLPHVFMSEVALMLLDDLQRTECRDIEVLQELGLVVDVLERYAELRSTPVDEVIIGSFLQYFPAHGAVGEAVRRRLGPQLSSFFV